MRTSKYPSYLYYSIRDWSLIMGGGGLRNGKIADLKRFPPPPLFISPENAPALGGRHRLKCTNWVSGRWADREEW